MAVYPGNLALSRAVEGSEMDAGNVNGQSDVR